MRFGHIELFCKNCNRTQEFYTQLLGFEETDVQGGKYIWLRSEETELLLRPTRTCNKANSYSENPVGLVFYCPDLEEFQSLALERGFELGPHDLEPGNVTVQDPDGRWVQVVEHMA